MSRGYFAYLIYVLLILLSCSGSGTINPPPNTRDSASIVIEYKWMEGYNLEDSSLVFFNTLFSFDYLYQPFADVGLEFYPYYDEEQLPPYSHYNPSYSYFPENRDDLLRDYADEYNCDSLSWHFYSVDCSETFRSDSIIVYGCSIQPGVDDDLNEPATPASERYSMLFTRDIIDWNSNTQSIIIPTFITVAVHELGHQRAGLTDATVYSIYHDMTFNCVMNYSSPMTFSPRFCKDITEPWQETSCKKVIEANYENF